MHDLDRALNQNPDLILLGGGNPARIPAVEQRLRTEMQTLLADGDRFERMIGVYDGPAGSLRFRQAMAAFLRREYGWNVGPENIALTNGSQSAFFLLFLLFCGPGPRGRQRLLFAQTPEYIGYADAPLFADAILQAPPVREESSTSRFRYRIDVASLEKLSEGPDPIGAVVLSRPCNPTGGVCSDDELLAVHQLARRCGAPLILDQAYGPPFPALCYAPAAPLWDTDVILCLSLSKIGMPGLRCGMVIADEAVVRALESLSAISSLAPGRSGPELALGLIESGELLRLAEDHARPFYRQRRDRAVETLDAALAGCPGVKLHEPMGAFFFWLHAEKLKVSQELLFERIAARGVLATPGRYFYPGLAAPPPEAAQTMRLSYAQPPEAVARGLRIVAEEIKRASGGA